MQGERNYHIFYQLIAGLDAHPELKSLLFLESPSAFAYTNQSGVDHIDGVSDETDFEEVSKPGMRLKRGNGSRRRKKVIV